MQIEYFLVREWKLSNMVCFFELATQRAPSRYYDLLNFVINNYKYVFFSTEPYSISCHKVLSSFSYNKKTLKNVIVFSQPSNENGYYNICKSRNPVVTCETFVPLYLFDSKSTNCELKFHVDISLEIHKPRAE